MKKNLFRVLSLAMAFLCLSTVHAQETKAVSIIPQPQKLEAKGGEYLLPEKVVIGYDDSFKDQAEYLQEMLARSTGRHSNGYSIEGGFPNHYIQILKSGNNKMDYWTWGEIVNDSTINNSLMNGFYMIISIDL